MILERSLLLVVLLTTAACSSPAKNEARHEPQTPAAPAAAPAAPAAAPAAAHAAAATPDPAAGPLIFAPQAGWNVETPSSAMRKAQYSLPRAGSDGEDASLVVYFFGGTGGSPQANIERWAGQFEQPDGRASADVLHSETRTLNGMNATEVELSGTYVAETAPGSGEHVRKEGWRMLATIVEAKEGPYYVKLVGPQATVTHWEASYHAFVNGMKPGR